MYANSFETDPDQVIFQLACRVSPPMTPAVLGHMECTIKRPDGTIALVSGDDINTSWTLPLSPELPQVPAAGFWYTLDSLFGRYEVRWYGTERKRYEIARKTFEIALTSTPRERS